MTLCISGSMAFDNIMVFPDRFAEHILPTNIHVLSVSFQVPTLTRQFGGIAGNIAYNLAQLGVAPLVLATIGEDGESYRARLHEMGVRTTAIKTIADTYTAQCFIITDLDNNQITAFHPGAMNFSHDNQVPAHEKISLALLGPDGREGMLIHAQQFVQLGIPYLFDPGQAIPIFSGAELLQLLHNSAGCVVNDYEAQMLMNKCGLDLAALAAQVDPLIVTYGAQGAKVHHQGMVAEVPAYTPEKIVDPTGCGDAFRAGLLCGRQQGLDWVTSARWGAKIAARKIACPSGQSHQLQPEDKHPPL